MPTVKSSTHTSVGLGSTGPVEPGPRKAMPTTGAPDRNDRRNQRNYLDDLVAGVQGPGLTVSGGNKTVKPARGN